MNSVEHRLAKLHDRFLYAALFLGFLAVVTGGASPWWLTIGFPIGLVAAHQWYRRQLASDDHNRWWNALIVVVLVLSIAEYLLNPVARLMTSSVRFALVLTLIKCFSRQGPRDELQIYALSFLTMAAASEVNEEVFYGILFALYVLTGTFSLALFHLKTEAKRHRRPTARRRSPFDRLYITVLATMSMFVLASSILLFFAFPRIGLGLFSDPGQAGASIAGFSDDVEVGDHGTLRDNPSVIMRVDFDGDPPDHYNSYLWRVMTFDEYDGSGWKRTVGDTKHTVSHSLSHNYDLDRLYTPALRDHFADDEADTLTIDLEPLGTSAIPTLWPTNRIQMDHADSSAWTDSMPTVEADAYGDLHHTHHDDIELSYQIDVQPSPSPDELRRDSGRQLNPDDARRYLQLPDDTDPDVQNLADEWTADADSNYEMATAIGDHFFSEFEYTVELPEITGDDPVAEFLFDHREGHCEYFATAAAVLLRSVDVPTRLVNGFLGGSYNDVGDYLTVRQGDAHTWVEIFVPELGWVPYDPTPPLESAFLDRSRLFRWAADVFDAARHSWNVWVLDYDLDDQIEMLRNIGQSFSTGAGVGADDDPDVDDDQSAPLPLGVLFFWTGWLVIVVAVFWRTRTRRNAGRLRRTVGIVIACLVAAAWTGWFQAFHPYWMSAGVASVVAAIVLATLSLHRRSTDDIRTATRQFHNIERAAARRGLSRRPDEGPDRYLDRLCSHTDDDAPDFETFRTLYFAVRFGNRNLSDDDHRRLRSAARAIITAIRRTET